jgi:Trk K+ transport system NAD-binding subunit
MEDVGLDTPDHHHMHSIELLDTYSAIGHSIESLGFLRKIRIVALRRNGVSSNNPLPDVEFKTGDVLVVEGHPDDIQALEIEIMAGL